MPPLIWPLAHWHVAKLRCVPVSAGPIRPNTYADDTRGKRVISSYIPLYQMARDVKGTASRGKKESQVSFRALHFLGFRTVSLPLFPPIPLLYVPTRHYNCDITILPFVSSMYVLGLLDRGWLPHQPRPAPAAPKS